MGGDTEVKKFLVDVIAVEAFKNIDSPEWSTLFTSGNYIIVRDYLIFFKGLPVEFQYTLDRLFSHFWADVEKHLFNRFRSITSYITVCDDRSNVTRAKEPTQSARVEASSKSYKKRGLEEEVDAYPLGTTFVPLGVKLPDGCIEGICLRKLSKSRSYDGSGSNLGNELWQAFFPYIMKAMQGIEPDLQHRAFIFDFDKRGPWVFLSGKPAIQRLDMQHDLGEAEPAGIWWANHFQNDPMMDHGPIDIHLLSSDGDNMPLSTQYLDQVKITAKLWWHCKPGEVVADMNKIAEQVLTRFQSGEHFALAFYLPGCDYMFKVYYAYYFNCRAIMDAVSWVDYRSIKAKGQKIAEDEFEARALAREAKKAAGQAIDKEAEEDKVDRFRWVPLFFEAFLVELYFTKVQGIKVAASAAAARALKSSDYTVLSMRRACALKKSKTIRFPSELELEYQSQMLKWLVEYGATAKDGKKPPDPLSPCAALLAERMHNLSLQTPRAAPGTASKEPKAAAAAAAAAATGNWAAASRTTAAATGNWQASRNAVANAVNTAAAAAKIIPPDTDRALKHKKSKHFMPMAPPSSPNDGFQLPMAAAAAITRSVDSFLLPPPAPLRAPSTHIHFGDIDSEIESFV